MPLTGELERERARTYPGQASWGGYDGQTTCRECMHWDFSGYLADGVIKKAPCKKTQALMNITKSAAVPDYALVCKYFVRNAIPPPRYKGVI